MSVSAPEASRSPIRRMAQIAVEPVPRPTAIPLRTQSSTAASPAARLAAVTASLSVTVVRVRLARSAPWPAIGFARPSDGRVPSTGGHPESLSGSRGEASPSPVYGAALLMRFGSQAHRGFKSLRLRPVEHGSEAQPDESDPPELDRSADRSGRAGLRRARPAPTRNATSRIDPARGPPEQPSAASGRARRRSRGGSR